MSPTEHRFTPSQWLVVNHAVRVTDLGMMQPSAVALAQLSMRRSLATHHSHDTPEHPDTILQDFRESWATLDDLFLLMAPLMPPGSQFQHLSLLLLLSLISSAPSPGVIALLDEEHEHDDNHDDEANWDGEQDHELDERIHLSIASGSPLIDRFIARLSQLHPLPVGVLSYAPREVFSACFGGLVLVRSSKGLNIKQEVEVIRLLRGQSKSVQVTSANDWRNLAEEALSLTVWRVYAMDLQSKENAPSTTCLAVHIAVHDIEFSSGIPSALIDAAFRLMSGQDDETIDTTATLRQYLIVARNSVATLSPTCLEILRTYYMAARKTLKVFHKHFQMLLKIAKVMSGVCV